MSVIYKNQKKYRNLEEDNEESLKGIKNGLKEKKTQPELSDRSNSLTVPSKKSKCPPKPGRQISGDVTRHVDIHVIDAESPVVVTSDEAALVEHDANDVTTLTEGVQKITIDTNRVKKNKKKKKLRKRV